MENHEIKWARACYTGGGIYIYWGQLTNDLYFRAWDECEAAYICDTYAGIENEDADYLEFYDEHTVEEITDDTGEFTKFWNAILLHIIENEPFGNYCTRELEHRLIK